MTTESTQPQPELGPAPANGQVQSQGHRRRRRRRKNKSSQQNAPQAQQAQAPAQPQPQAPPQAPQQRPAQAHQNQGRGRRRSSSRRVQPLPRSPATASPGLRRASAKASRRDRGSLSVPWTTATAPSTATWPTARPRPFQIWSNGHGSCYPDAYPPPPPVPVREDAPTRIFCFIEDLFFQAKIQETSRKLGIKVEFVKGDKDSVARLPDLPDTERPTLLVFDLNNLNAKPMALIPKFKTKLKKATSIIGFLNHLQGDLKMKAIEAGCDTVMPRSAFSQSLPNLLRRYGVEEEEEYAQQPM